MGKLLSHIRPNDRIDRMFVGTHFEKNQGRQAWYEAGHIIKGASFDIKHVVEKSGDGGEAAGAGYLVSMSGEYAQSLVSDYADYENIFTGLRNIAIVTGTPPLMMLRIFRLHYNGANQWDDNRLAIVTDDAYNSGMNKAPFRVSGWVRTFERYAIKSIAVRNKALSFDDGTSIIALLDNSGHS